MAFAVPSVQKEKVQTQQGRTQQQGIELPKVPNVDLHVSRLEAERKEKTLIDTSKGIH